MKGMNGIKTIIAMNTNSQDSNEMPRVIHMTCSRTMKLAMLLGQCSLIQVNCEQRCHTCRFVFLSSDTRNSAPAARAMTPKHA